MSDSADDSLPPPIGESIAPIRAVLERHFAHVRAWQQTPEGRRERERFERNRIAKARAERDELCTLRGVPDDIEVRRWAPIRRQAACCSTRSARRSRGSREQQQERGGLVPVVRFCRVPGDRKDLGSCACSRYVAEALALRHRRRAAPRCGWRVVRGRVRVPARARRTRHRGAP